MGVKRGKNRVFWDFLKKEPSDLVHSPIERRYQMSTYVRQISSTGIFLFPRYWVKRGQKWSFLGFSQNDCNNLVHSHGESSYKSTYVCQVSSPRKYLFPRYGVK